MSDARPVRCQKCGKPLGYVTVVVKGLTPLSQPLQNLKIIAICIQVLIEKNDMQTLPLLIVAEDVLTSFDAYLVSRK